MPAVVGLKVPRAVSIIPCPSQNPPNGEKFSVVSPKEIHISKSTSTSTTGSG